MEATNAHIDRHHQLTELYEQISASHESLRLAYASTTEALKKSKLAVINYKNQAHYWETQFKKIKVRENELEAELEELKAKLRKREQQLFGMFKKITTYMSPTKS